jgi:hypothetical protein
VNTLEQERGERLELNDIGRVTIQTTRALFFDAYRTNRSTGAFILIDPISNSTAAAGMIQEPIREPATDRAAQTALSELNFEAGRLTPAERYARAGHYPATIWLTARQDLTYLIERKLFERNCQVHVVAEDTESHILPEVAALLHAAGLISIISGSTLDAAERERARTRVGRERFFDFDPRALAPDDERAAEQILAALEERGVLPHSRFHAGEGI